jgi:hypothetical protein
MADQERYTKAMVRGDVDTCARIEQSHDLYGYPPALVSIGLAAAARGEDAAEAVEKYLNGEDMK